MGRTDHQDLEAAVRRVRGMIERLVREGTAVARSDGTRHDLFPVAASAAEGEALRGWVVREGATRTVEVGLGYAISALHVCEGLLRGGALEPGHVTIDPFQATRFSGCGLQFLAEAGVSGMVEHIPERSEAALPRLLGEGRLFDLAFVDSDHRFDGVLVDLFYLVRLVRPGGAVFLDDYQLPAVERAAAFFVANLGWGSPDRRSSTGPLGRSRPLGECRGRSWASRWRAGRSSRSTSWPTPSAWAGSTSGRSSGAEARTDPPGA